MTTRTNVTAKKALEMLGAAMMRPFTKEDWMGFSGCEDPNPTIGYVETYVLVVDGNTLLVLEQSDEYGGQTFTLVGVQ